MAAAKALFLEHLRLPFFIPKPLLTRDQVRLLKYDNVVGINALGIEELGVKPTPLYAVLPTYLNRYRRGKDVGQATRIN